MTLSADPTRLQELSHSLGGVEWGLRGCSDPVEACLAGGAAASVPSLAVFLSALSAARARHLDALRGLAEYYGAASSAVDQVSGQLDAHESSTAREFEGELA